MPGLRGGGVSPILLEVAGLRRPPLAPTDLRVAGGEIVAISGPSGAGKSLLLRAIADLDPAEGDVRLGGRPRDAWSGPDWRSQVTYVAPVPGWWADRAAAHFPPGVLEGAASLLQALDIGPALLTRPVSELSTGEAQRLGLARALAGQRRVLLLDEPTSSLDPASTARVERLLGSWVGATADRAVLLTSHDQAQARRLADRRMHMRDGSLEPVA